MTRFILIAIALLGLAAIAWQVADAFVLAFGAIVFATVLRTLATPLRRATGWSEKISLMTVVLVLLIVLGLLGWLFGHQAAQQFAEMRQQLPAALDKFQTWLSESRLGRVAVDALKQTSQGAGSPLSNASGMVGGLLNGVGHLLLIVFAGIYLAVNPGLYRNGALRLLPPSRRKQVGGAMDEAGGALQKWLVAQLLVMAVVGLTTGVGLALIGVPLSLSLGLLAGILEFVPVVGPIVATVPGVLIGFALGPETALYALFLYIAVQQIESNVLTPLIQRWAVKLPPAIALLSIVVGGLLFGIMGVIFATPLAVVVMVLVRRLYVEDTVEKGADPKTPASSVLAGKGSS